MRLGENVPTDFSFFLKTLEAGKLKKGLYVGYTGFGNLGDEALRDAIFDLFANKILFSESRGMSVRLGEKIKLLSLDTLMLGGGTLLLWSREILDALTAPGFEHRVAFGTGVADPDFFKSVSNQEFPLQEWLEVLPELDYLGVRGPLSKQALINLGITNAEITGDPVLTFTREIKRKKTGLKRKLGVNWGTSVDVWGNELIWGGEEAGFLEKFAGFLKKMVDEGWEVEVIPVWDKDRKAIEKVLEMTRRSAEIRVFEDYHSVSKTLDRLETFDVFIGEKLHSVILSCCANTPAVMLEYQPKCRDFMASIGREDFTIRTDCFEISSAKQLVEDLYQKRELIRGEVYEKCLFYKKRLREAARQVAAKIYLQAASNVLGGIS